MTPRKYSTIKNAEWICWRWIEVTTNSDTESMFIRGTQRPLDEAMRLAGGSIQDLAPYLWALRFDANGEDVSSDIVIDAWHKALSARGIEA